MRFFCLIFFLPTILFGQHDSIPFLGQAVTIDGDVSEWKEHAFHDGLWDMHRVAASDWYHPARNRITLHPGENSSLSEDLQARYYLAWDTAFLYLGAEVWDNAIDVSGHREGERRWYDKDCVAFFIESPGDSISEKFGRGDHGFCLVPDSTFPANATWWRSGSPDTNYLEYPLNDCEYDMRIHASGYVLEAKVDLARTFGKRDPQWPGWHQGSKIRLCIVHTDPDGGGYGGHLLMYGKGDDDASWQMFRLGGEKKIIQRRDH
ncbi:MAG: sugar-binding protein [Bacteroidota bacterium]